MKLPHCSPLGFAASLIFAQHLVLTSMNLFAAEPATKPGVRELGNRLELFVDRQEIESLDGARLVLHEPRPAEVALRLDPPHEGKYAAYFTVFPDGDRFRMYYRGWAELGKDEKGEQLACLAESSDGVQWTRPKLGLFEVGGSRDNNVVWPNPSHNFTPFKDPRPDVPADERYKALNVGKGPSGAKGLMALASPDGVHWRLLSPEPVFTKGAFDSQNLAFWDTNLKKYRCYFRVFTNKIRAVAVTTSDDFRTWSEAEQIDLGAAPEEHFYTNATTQYFRAPHYYFAFPKRYVAKRRKLPDHTTPGISDAVFLSSRDGIHFDRTYREAFIRPGRDQLNWGDRSVMVAWGLVQTGPDEMSVYYSQNYRYPTHHIRRGVLRLDGIASVQAGYTPGEVITKPFTFTGKRLVLNYATSAAGGVQVEVQSPDGKPLAGCKLDDAEPLYGDEIDGVYRWQGGDDVSKLAGQPVRLRFVLQDADLYSYRFAE